MQTKLDEYEKEIENNFSQQEKIGNVRQQKEKFRQASVRHQKRKRSITIRIADYDLEAIKIKASKDGLAYQTYINMIIHKEATKL